LARRPRLRVASPNAKGAAQIAAAALKITEAKGLDAYGNTVKGAGLVKKHFSEQPELPKIEGLEQDVEPWIIQKARTGRETARTRRGTAGTSSGARTARGKTSDFQAANTSETTKR